MCYPVGNRNFVRQSNSAKCNVSITVIWLSGVVVRARGHEFDSWPVHCQTA